MTAPADACPDCGDATRDVDSTTLCSLLTASSMQAMEAESGYRFCKNSRCPVVYHHPDNGQRFGSADLKVVVFQKSRSPRRPVCYCFDHSVEQVGADARDHGKSLIAEDITRKCREALDRCEETNPQGSCCLGNVRQVARDALEAGGHWVPPAEPCCADDANDGPTEGSPG